MEIIIINHHQKKIKYKMQQNSTNKAQKQIRFLIATDVHLGHAQNHQQLGNDSYIAFQQVLSIAKKQNVDFLLLGGDLFDQVNPTQKCIFKCLNLLRDNIFGQRQLSIGVKGIVPNFSNQNLNISLPIFTIHGNHDYPSNDFGKISVCDLLNASNYVNYFGKHLNLVDHGVKKINVKPIIFQKKGSTTKLAIYGLGYIKDLKLNKMLQDKLVIFQQPEKKEQTVCILIIHQNRFKGKKGGVGPSYQNCIHPEQLPKWMELVLWCHQHQAIRNVEQQAGLLIFQPGSTVITSYIQAEGFQKQCGLITVGPGKQYDITRIPLQKSFRPMITRSYSLQEIIDRTNNQKINFHEYFDIQLSNILGQLHQQNPHNTKKPIIRIKIDYTGQQIIRLIKIEQKYRELVANSNKIFTYTQKRQPKKNFTLQDTEVLDMIKNNKIPKNITRQTQLTQQIMQILTEQLTKSKLSFFEIGHLKQMITDLSKNQGRTNMSDLKQTYARQIQLKCGEMRKNVHNFHTNNNKQFKRIYQKLLNNVNGDKYEELALGDLQADISRLNATYVQKQKQVLQIFQGANQKSSVVSQPQKSTKSTVRVSDNQRQRSSIIHVHHSHRDSSSEGNRSVRLSNNSQDEQDCCKRAERETYRENQTRGRFVEAVQMLQNKNKQSKGKKNVRFKD